jgi:hypothetical protein
LNRSKGLSVPIQTTNQSCTHAGYW